MNIQRSAFAEFRGVITIAVFITLLCASDQARAQQNTASPTAAPITLTLQDALTRAQKNEPQYRAALAQYGVARANVVQGRAGLLPNVSFASTYLYTQGNGTPASRFIANNGVHEYLDQGDVHQALSWQTVAEYRLARAQAALAKAQAEIATRG